MGKSNVEEYSELEMDDYSIFNHTAKLDGKKRHR